MAKEWEKKFLNSKAWLCCRDSYIAERLHIDGGRCEICKEEFGYIVHHTIQLDENTVNDPEIALNHDLLQYVCKDCHDWEPGHFYDSHGVKRSRCRFDAEGNPVER